MSELVKRQHFVPRTYLKHFGFEKNKANYIWVLPKASTTEQDIFDSNIQNVALKKHLYTLPGKTVAQKMMIEKFYSEQLEDKYDQIHSLLVDPEKTAISATERDLIITTVVTMFYRTMHWISLHNGFMKQVFENMFELCAQTGKDYFLFEGKKISIAGKSLEQFTNDHNKSEQPGMVMLQLETAMKLVTLRLQNDAIMVCKLGNEDAEFITNDNPVIATNSKVDRIMPFDWENTLRLPLDPKHELLLIPNGEKETMNQVFRNELFGEHCENEKLVVNYLQMSMAETFMFGTKSGLKSYLATKEETERKIKAG